MKKFLAFITIFALILSLTACDNNGTLEVSIDANVSAFKVGVLFAGDPETPYSFEAAHYAGIKAAMEHYNMDISTHLLVKKNLGREETAVTDAINKLIGDGANVIFGTDYTFFSAMETCASANPQIAFAHCSGLSADYANFVTYFGRMYQACYLTGIVAGAKALKAGYNTVGYVSDHGVEYSEYASAINAFTLGVQAVYPETQIYVMPTGTWGDSTGESNNTHDLAVSYRCYVVGQQCNSPLPLQTLEDHGVYGCGYGTDMTQAAPESHLASAVWNWEVFYLKAIKVAAECENAESFAESLGDSIYYGGLKEGLVGITPLSKKCPAGTQDAIDKVKKLIVSGKWDVFSGVKLQISLKNGKATVKQYDAPLVNQMGEEILAAGEPSMHDDFIRSMSYFLISVLDA